MEWNNANFTFNLVGPASLLAFGSVFIWAYFSEKKYSPFLFFAASAWLFAAAMTIQLGYAIATVERLPLVTNLLYLGAAISACSGFIARQQRTFSLALPVFIFCIIGLQTWYFTELAPNPLARIYLLNFACGLILSVTAIYIRPDRDAVIFERALFWALLIFGLHFFPRTILTAGLGLQMDPQNFLSSAYWIGLQFSLALLGVFVGIAALLASTNDIIDDLRRERHIDALTGVLSRQAFRTALDQSLRLEAHPPRYLALIDIDNFRAINLAIGKAGGDRILAELAGFLQGQLSRYDSLGRYQGQQFLIASSAQTHDEAEAFLRTWAKAIAQHNFAMPQTLQPLTITTGLTELSPDEPFGKALERAQRQLETAKAARRPLPSPSGPTASAGHTGPLPI